LGGRPLGIFEAILSYVAVGLASASAGLVLGGTLTSSKIDGLYERLERAEAANRAQTQLLDELTQTLSHLLDDLSLSRNNSATPEGAGGARQMLERLRIAAELRARLDDSDLTDRGQPR